jgi:hypothetical protein
MYFPTSFMEETATSARGEYNLPHVDIDILLKIGPFMGYFSLSKTYKV